MRKQKLQFGETRDHETTFTMKEKLQYECFNVILDSIISELKRRKEAYQNVHNLFSFLFHLKDMEPEEIKINAHKLAKFYNQDGEMDLNDEFFAEECVHFKHFHLSIINFAENAGHYNTSTQILKYITEQKLISTFPNIHTAFQLF